MRYQVVEAYRKDYPVSVLCETLGVSLSDYYAWKTRPMSQHQREDHQLAEHIQEVYHSCRQVYGSPRIHAELRDQGIMSSRKRVARLMREQGLSACRRHHRTITTKSEPGARVAPNVLDQDFTASRPNEKWTGDMTAIWTYEGWLYLAVVLDLFSRRVIRWAMAATQDEALIETALRMALLAMSNRCGNPNVSGFHNSGSTSGYENVADGIVKAIEQIQSPGLSRRRKLLIAQLDQLIETVREQMQPPGRAQAVAHTLQQLSPFIPDDVTLADLITGWWILSHSSERREEPATTQRRVTCGELATIASQITDDEGILAQAIKTWSIWAKAIKKSDDPRQTAMAKTFARELKELQEAMR